MIGKTRTKANWEDRDRGKIMIFGQIKISKKSVEIFSLLTLLIYQYLEGWKGEGGWASELFAFALFFKFYNQPMVLLILF